MRPRSFRLAFVALACAAVAAINQASIYACTAFCAIGADGHVLVGNNEDYYNPRTKIWFVPAKPGSFGRMYVGFDNLWPQGGMNERGLWFDGFAAPPVRATESAALPHFPGNIVDAAMATCSTVEEVVRLFSQYNRSFLTEGILMFADASGDAVAIEVNAMVRKSGKYFVQANFHQSRPQADPDRGRFAIASGMLDRAGDQISPDLFRRILAETHQTGSSPTLYSNVYDLTSRTMSLYHFHDFERAVTFDLAEELKNGERVLDIPALFPRKTEAETFAARLDEGAGLSAAVVIAAAVAIGLLSIALAVFAWMRAGRRVRIALSLGVAVMVGVIALSMATLNMQRRPAESWIRFSIGPAAGDSSSITSSTIRSNGLTLRSALGIAYDLPAVRIVGPPWISSTRYSINAIVGLDEMDSFRSLLRQELKDRLKLETHVEKRPFDVFVLEAGESPRLQRSAVTSQGVWVGYREARLRDASMERLASALQSIVDRPVVDETGITGSYDMDLEFGDDRIGTVTQVLRDRFGLRLMPATRDLEALIVDRAERDVAMLLLAQIGRLTAPAPSSLRQRIADIMSIR